ncbi:hypothetical protein J2Y69_001964 [Microbacterium resistens]|uniref:Uncharacterized protein n=1 Tax=Microbacterium resistens TaxID=156977 RepID=A0ABU1SCN3_9MICO|nr:hypothetical protein [Microbacterium resistens]MDR6867361.1 hypothetical protein [Microbacterium resistens]
MRTTGPRLPIALTTLVLAAGVLTACAGGAGGLKPEDSPLGQYLAAASGGDLSEEEQNRRFEEQNKKQEELVAQCMAKEGFEYKPFTGNTAIAVSGDGDWDPESRGWVEKYGYGAVNSPWAERHQDPGEGPDESMKDPNQEYLETLSESEQAAFNEVLHGKMPDPAEMGEDGSFEWKWEDAGCQGWAQHEIGAGDPWQADEFSGLRDRMQKFWEGTQESAPMKELDGKWASCMADAGEPGFTKQGDAAQTIYDAMNKIYEAANGNGSVGGGTGATPPPSEVSDPADVPDPSKSPEMKELGEKEVALALKDLDCREKTAYRDTQIKNQFALEEEFIAANKADLEAFKAAAEQSK